MKIKISNLVPHVVAILIFWLVLVILFTPIFTKHQAIKQYDVEQWAGTAKSIIDYREKTGEEALWASSVFVGMPAYLISVVWSNQPITLTKKIVSLGMDSPMGNLFISMLSFYILLLSFKVRPYLSIAGAVAFGLSSFIIIGVIAGHNGRIGAIAFLPLVIAGIHLLFEDK